MGKFLLGIDNGLSVVKAVVFDIYGKEIGMYSVKSGFDKNDGVHCEAGMISIWDTTAFVIRKAIEASKVDPKDILAVSNSATGNGLYFTDIYGEPFHNAILPMDKRAFSIVQQWNKSGVGKQVFNSIAQMIWPGQPGPLLQWMKTNSIEQYSKIGKIYFRKDWINYKLTDNHSTDYTDISASGLFNNTKKTYDSDILGAYGILEMEPCLPKVLYSHEICGHVTKKAAAETGLAEGTPVATGLFDVDACTIGSGVIRDNQFMMIAGTWSINASISNEVVKSADITQSTIFADGKRYLNIDSGATSSTNFEWFLDNVSKEYRNIGYEKCNEIIRKFSADEVNIIYLPYIHSSLKYPKLTASFVGLQSNHTSEHLMRAVYEGIAFGHRENLDCLKKCGLDHSKVRFTGGLSRSSEWCQMFSDILSKEIEVTAAQQTGALGAAISAGIAIGVYKDYEDAIDKLIVIKETFKTCASNAEIYEKKYEKFIKVLRLISDL